VLGIFDDVARRVPMGFPRPAKAGGDLLFLLGETRVELSGSEWAWVTHGHLGGRPPKVDLAAEQALGKVMAQASKSGLVSAAHDLSDGGLAQVLVESTLRHGVGAKVTFPEDGNSPFIHLFSESASRALVAVPRGHDKAFLALAEEHGVGCTPIGVTAEEPVLEVQGEFSIPLDELRVAYGSTMRELFGGPGELANRHGDPEKARHPEDDPITPLAQASAPPAAEEERPAAGEEPAAEEEPAAADDQPAAAEAEPAAEATVPEPVPVETDAEGTTFVSQAAQAAEPTPDIPAESNPDDDEDTVTATAPAPEDKSTGVKPPPDNFPTADVK
jgi:hypothetical protein